MRSIWHNVHPHAVRKARLVAVAGAAVALLLAAAAPAEYVQLT